MSLSVCSSPGDVIDDEDVFEDVSRTCCTTCRSAESLSANTTTTTPQNNKAHPCQSTIKTIIHEMCPKTAAKHRPMMSLIFCSHFPASLQPPFISSVIMSLITAFHRCLCRRSTATCTYCVLSSRVVRVQFTREEFQQNYQRFVREHLDLERSYALLQATHGAAFTDPQREDRVSNVISYCSRHSRT